MAEPSAGTAPRSDASGAEVLLATKLYVPPRRASCPRPRLRARLDEGLARGLTLVCAPAGFGKTSLLADWTTVASGQWPGFRWMRATTTQRGFGGTWSPRWAGCDQRPPSG
jgi:hypothetical protein